MRDKLLYATIVIGLMGYGIAEAFLGGAPIAIYAWLICVAVCVAGIAMASRRTSDALDTRYNRDAILARMTTHYTKAEWRALCEYYDNCCLCCGNAGNLTADHVTPIYLGGTDDISNIQPLCKSCNSAKGASTIDYRIVK